MEVLMVMGAASRGGRWVALVALAGCLSRPTPADIDAGAGDADAAVADAASSDAAVADAASSDAAVVDAASSDAAVADAASSDAAVADAASLDAAGPPTGVVDIAAGRDHACALLDNGAVRCWGAGQYGRLGYANEDAIGLTSETTPITAGDVNLGGRATQITAGRYHTCALMENRKVRCWGRGLVGQLGYGDSENVGDDEHPAAKGDVPVGGDVTQITAGALHTCALLDDGQVKCWGAVDDGRGGYPDVDEAIGDDEWPSMSDFVDIADPGDTVTQISAGAEHTCARISDGGVRCWGRARDGQLGYADAHGVDGSGDPVAIGDDETPRSAGDVNVGATVEYVSAGTYHTCAVLTGGGLKCWGNGTYGRLGYGNIDDIGATNTPADVGNVPIGGTVTEVATSTYHTCVHMAGNAARCFGIGDAGRLGYGHTFMIGDTEPASAAGDVPVGGTVEQVVTGGDFTCARMTSGQVRCWGFAASGQLGYGNNTDIGDDEPASDAGDVPLF